MGDINTETLEELIEPAILYKSVNGELVAMSVEESLAHIEEMSSIIIPAPSGIEMRQLRLYLLNLDLLVSVKTAIAAQTDEAVKIEWEYATVVLRGGILLSTIAEILELDSDGIDDLLREAIKL